MQIFNLAVPALANGHDVRNGQGILAAACKALMMIALQNCFADIAGNIAALLAVTFLLLIKNAYFRR